MKHLRIFLALVAALFSVRADLPAPIASSVPVSTNMVLLGKGTNLFSANTLLLLQALRTNLSGGFRISADLTYDGAPGGGGGVWPFSEYHQNLANWELNQVGNTYIDGKTNTTLRGQTELDILSLGKLGLYMEDVLGVYPATNLVLTFDGTLTDQGWPRLRALPLEQMILSGLSSGQVLGTSTGKKPASITQSSYLSGLDSAAVSTIALAATNAALITKINSASNTLATALALKQTQPFQFTSSGLTLTVGAGTVIDAAGVVTTFAGASTNIIGSYTNHVYLINGRLVCMSRAIHRGGVYLGQAITGSSNVTSITQPTRFNYFPTRIGRWLRKAAHGEPETVWGLGDSITQGAQATGGSNWMNLCFSATYSSYGLNVANVANVTPSNYGQSGANSAWALAFTGDRIARTYGGAGIFIAASAHRTRFNNAQMPYTYQKVIGTTTPMRSAPDLVVTGFGNLAGYDLELSVAQWETAIRRLLSAGSEVVMHTEEPFYNGGGGSIGNWTPLQDAARMAAIADANCIPIVDTFAMMQWLHDAGVETTYYNADHVHPNNAGHNAWAMLMDSVISPGVNQVAESYAPRRRSQYPSGSYASAYGAGVDLLFDYTGTGTAGTDPNVGANGALNLNTIATGAATTNNAYLLTAGQYVEAVHGGCLSLGVITGLGPGQTASCHMEQQTSTNAVGSAFTVYGAYGNQITKIYQLGDFAGIGITTWCEGANSPSRLPCYGFDLKLVVDSFSGGGTNLPVIGFVCETPERRELGAPTLIGTWSSENTANTHEQQMLIPYTDTANSSATWQFSTDMAEAWVVVGTQSGSLVVTVDGEVVINNAHLYTGGAGFIYHLFLQPGNSPGNHTSQVGYRTARTTTHSACMTVVTPGGTPVAGNRSLQILAVHGLNFE